MVDLDPNQVKIALFNGLAPIDQRIAALKNKKASRIWDGFVGGATKKLLTGSITVDEWRGALGHCTEKLSGCLAMGDAEAIQADAESAAAEVEQVFDPPQRSMRWLVIGGIATAALAYWWMRRSEKKNKLPMLVPETTTGSPRKNRRPVIEINPEDVIEAEEI
jgi:hypothetical protein